MYTCADNTLSDWSLERRAKSSAEQMALEQIRDNMEFVIYEDVP